MEHIDFRLECFVELFGFLLSMIPKSGCVLIARRERNIIS
ncbi:MAG: hypothetical protein RLZZ505_671 [Verrucomicrobiota bacterium]|jgi:hypothetical protein